MAESTVSISGVTYTVYGSQAGWDDYIKGSANGAAARAASTADKNRARVEAARSFDRQRWAGTATDPTTPQALQWPRDGVVNAFGQASDGVTPAAIERGNWEWAMAIIADPALAQKVPGTNTRRTRTRDKVDVLETEQETEYFRPTIAGPGNGSPAPFPPAVMDLIGSYLEGTTSALGFSSGTDVTSGFTAEDVDFSFTGTGLDGGSNS